MRQLSSLELGFIEKELQQLVGARLDQVYQPARKELFLQFHVRSKGRALLKVSVPQAVYLASGREPVAEVSGFCSLLRKKLKNSVLTAIRQEGFERVLHLDFASKSAVFSLFLELFSKGNIILVQDGKILAAAEKQSWSSRELSQGADYKLPPAAKNPSIIDDKQLLQLLQKTNKTDLVRFLAIELSLGGLYAEELCLLSGIDKNVKPASIAAAAAKKLLQSLKQLLNSSPSPSLIYENSKAVDAVPVSLSCYENHEKKPCGSYSEALEAFNAATASRPSRSDSAISRLKAIMAQQQGTIASAEILIEKNSRSAELIYEHYQEVKDLLAAVNAARKQGGWAAVKQLQKASKKLKSVDEKAGTVTVDIQ